MVGGSLQGSTELLLLAAWAPTRQPSYSSSGHVPPTRLRSPLPSWSGETRLVWWRGICRSISASRCNVSGSMEGSLEWQLASSAMVKPSGPFTSYYFVLQPSLILNSTQLMAMWTRRLELC